MTASSEFYSIRLESEFPYGRYDIFTDTTPSAILSRDGNIMVICGIPGEEGSGHQFMFFDLSGIVAGYCDGYLVADATQMWDVNMSGSSVLFCQYIAT